MATMVVLTINNQFSDSDRPNEAFDMIYEADHIYVGATNNPAAKIVSSKTHVANNGGVYSSGPEQNSVSGIIGYTLPDGYILVMYFDTVALRLLVVEKDEFNESRQDVFKRASQAPAYIVGSFFVGDSLYQFQVGVFHLDESVNSLIGVH